MRILAVDIGTKTGVAYSREEDFSVETLKLASPREVKIWGQNRLTRRNDPRIDRLCEKLSALGQFDIVVFEDVTFSTTPYACQLWAALRAALWLCVDAKYFEAVNVQTLKRFAGARSQEKSAMSAALKLQHPELWKPAYDDNAIDAVWLWLWAKKNLQRINTNSTIS